MITLYNIIKTSCGLFTKEIAYIRIRKTEYMYCKENDIFKKIYAFDCDQSIYSVFTRSIVVNTWSGAEPR